MLIMMEHKRLRCAFIMTDILFDDVVGKCPNCGFPTVYEEGLEVCYYCGWSEEQEEEGKNV